MSKLDVWAMAYAAALQGCCSKHGVLETEKDRATMVEFCEKSANDAANAYSQWARPN